MDQESNRQRFAARLVALGLSRADVGAAVGVSGEAIRTWEVGAYAPRKKATVTKLEEALGARTGELWALLKGYEIPAKHPRQPDADTDPSVLREVLGYLREMQAQIDELRRETGNGEPPESHRGSRTRVPVPSRRAS
jgi:DNA-binding XRE family transcriptional regulator